MISATKKYIKKENGNVAIMIALFMPVFIGFVGLSVDLGILYISSTQLQTAADAGALAGTAELVKDSNGDSIVEADYYGAKTSAIAFTESNEILNNRLKWSENDTFEAGKWDPELGDFSLLGYSTDPKELDGSSVFLTRSVNTYFIKMFGISKVQLSARSTSFVGCAGDGTRADLPIAINKDKLHNPFEEIVLSSENEENGQYTSFDIWSCDRNSISPFIYGSKNGGQDPPPLYIGEEIYMNNGEIANLFSDLETRYDQEKDANGEYPVKLPVVEWSPPQNRGTLVGFVYFVITEVNGPGGKKTESKQIIGYMSDGVMLAQNSASGGKCYGVRASQPMIVSN